VWHNVSGAVVAKIYAKQQEKEERKKIMRADAL